MKYHNVARLLGVVFACLICASTAFAGEFIAAASDGVPETYSVVLKESAARKANAVDRPDLPTVASVAEDLRNRHGGHVVKVWEHALRGFLIEIPASKAQALARDPRVQAVIQDSYTPLMSATTEFCYTVAPHNTQSTGSPTSPQFINCTASSIKSCSGNWGLDRIDQTTLPLNQQFHFPHTGAGVDIYVVDTGVRATHDEFKRPDGTSRVTEGYKVPGYQFTKPANEDCVGHGTHVASILAGRTFGIAKEATIVPVKISWDRLSEDPNVICEANSRVSDVTDGLNWIVANHNPNRASIVNLSWNDPEAVTDPATLTAIDGLTSAKIALVQSAGNQGTAAKDYVLSSARSEVITVGASDELDRPWLPTSGDELYTTNCPGTPEEPLVLCGSNHGSRIDLYAPGAHITAASKQADNAYCRLTGTSMAAPHVTGVAALYLDRVGPQRPYSVRDRLVGKAEVGVLTNVPTNTSNRLLSINTANSNLAACFTGDCAGNTCTLDASCSTVDSDAFIKRYKWKFGDGTSQTTYQPTVTHTYAADDLWTAQLKIVVSTQERATVDHCVNTYNFGVNGCIQ